MQRRGFWAKRRRRAEFPSHMLLALSICIFQSQLQKFSVCRYDEHDTWIDKFKFPVVRGYTSSKCLIR